MAKILVIQHNDDDNLNDLAQPFIEAGLEIVQWHAEKTAAPVDSLAGFAGLVSLGAFAGVEEEGETTWMPVERRLIEAALEVEMPVLGLCFGSQLLASVAGAEVGKSGAPEVGWYSVEMTEEAGARGTDKEFDEYLRTFQTREVSPVPFWRNWHLPRSVPLPRNRPASP